MPLIFLVGAWAIALGVSSTFWPPVTIPSGPPSLARPDEDVGNRHARRRAAKLGL